MTTNLKSPEENTVAREPSAPLGLLFGITTTLLLFVAIPLAHKITAPWDKPPIEVSPGYVEPPPSTPPREEPARQQNTAQRPPEDLKQEARYPDYERFIADINPGQGPGIFDNTWGFRKATGPDMGDVIDSLYLDQAPKPVHVVPPLYPAILIRMGISGKVVLECIVDQEGRVGGITVVFSDRKEFERPAIEALKQWRFEPGMKGGSCVKSRIKQPISFLKPGG